MAIQSESHLAKPNLKTQSMSALDLHRLMQLYRERILSCQHMLKPTKLVNLPNRSGFQTACSNHKR